MDTHAGFYVDDRNFAFGNGVWVYEESNGVEHLQRGGPVGWGSPDNDACVDDPTVMPDTIVF